MKIIKTSEALPKSGRYVLAWLEGAKIPMRAMWAAQHTLPLGDDSDPEWGEYSEEKDEYFCPAGWYEMNQFEEQHWGVCGNVVAWCELPRLDHQCLAQIEEPAGAAPAAVAGPAWDKTRDSLATLLLGLARRPFLDFDVACIALDAATEPGMPLAYMRSAPAAPALEAPAAPAAPAVPLKATPEMRAAFRSAFREGGFWDDRLDYALDKMLAAAPQAPAAPSAYSADLLAALGQWHQRCEVMGAHHTLTEAQIAELVVAGLLRRAHGGQVITTAGRAALAAPAAPAVDASDTALLDAMERERIAVIPEFEGPWDAQIFGEDEATLACGSGATPREAITEALASLEARKAHDAAQAKEGGA